MTDPVVTLPPLVDDSGNMNVHGRAGFTLVVQSEDSSGVLIDISAKVIWFEVAGILRVRATTGSIPTEQYVVVSSDQVATLPLKVAVPFCIRDESVTPVDVWAAGAIRAYGFEGQPT